MAARKTTETAKAEDTKTETPDQETKTEETTAKAEDTKATTPTVVSPPKETPEGEQGPVDETDPEKRVSSVTAIPNAEALAVGTVDAVTELPKAPTPTAPEKRVEEYVAVKPDGTKVTVVHDLVTGKTRIK